MYRMANSRMRKSFSVNTLMRLTKSCPRYSLPLLVTSLPVLYSRYTLSLSALNLSLLNKRTDPNGQFRLVTYQAYIWEEVPFDHRRAKPARGRLYRRLASSPPQHPGSCLLSRTIRTDVLVTNLDTLLTARLDTHRSRRPRTHLSVRAR